MLQLCAEFGISATLPLQHSHLGVSLDELCPVTDVSRLTGSTQHSLVVVSHRFVGILSWCLCCDLITVVYTLVREPRRCLGSSVIVKHL